MKSASIYFLFWLCSFPVVAQSGQLIMSSVGPQEVYEGAGISVYFSTLKHFDTIDFSSDNLPDFGVLMNDGNGEGRILFNPTPGDEGSYRIDLNAVAGMQSNTLSFQLNVKPIPEAAEVYYLDPVHGQMDYSGTAEFPLPSLEIVLSNHLVDVNSNTFFLLRDGFHGSVLIQGSHTHPVHILAAANHRPFVKNMVFFFADNWYVSNVEVSSEGLPITDEFTLVKINAGCSKIQVTNSKIYNIEDASVWTHNDDWYAGTNRGWGIYSLGTACLFEHNYLKNIWFGVEMRRDNNAFSYNIINGFGADAVRALGDHQLVSYNQIKNATVFDYSHPNFPQHDDGIQSYVSPLSSTTPLKDIHIIGNQIADITDPNLTLPTEIMQGIVDFDGFEEDWVVANNLVITHHPHGIALYGAKNCKIVNNTVVRNPFNLFSTASFPWIRINPRKENVGGELSTGNLVRNNIMASYQTDNYEPGMEDHNIIGNSYGSFFEDYIGWDFHLAVNSAALNAGLLEDAPFVDLYQKRRPNEAIDAGCFEKEASMIDFEAPTMPTSINVTEINVNKVVLNWEASTDNSGVAYYEINVNGQELISSASSAQIMGLEPAQEYVASIRAVDYFNNHSEPSELTFTTQNLELLSTFYIPADKDDQMIKSNHQLMWAGMPFHRIGGFFGDFDASAVLPFRLPELDDGREIVSADLSMTLESVVNSPSVNVDLYGLEAANSSCVPANKHWQGSFGQDPNAFAISSGYIGLQTPVGSIHLNETGKMRLASYIEALLENGATVDDYAILRLNIGTNNGPNDAYYSLVSADNNNSFEIPILSIVTSGTSGIEVIEIENGLQVFPNPVTTQNGFEIYVQGFEAEPTRLLIHNVQGQEVYRQYFNAIEQHTSISIPSILEPGLYFLSLVGRQKYARTSLVVIE